MPVGGNIVILLNLLTKSKMCDNITEKTVPIFYLK